MLVFEGDEKDSLEPGPTLVDMVTTGIPPSHINKGWAWFEANEKDNCRRYKIVTVWG